MPGALVHVGCSATCPHGGMVSVVPGSPRVFVGGMAVATMADQYPVVGCAFTVPGPKPQPCVTVRWMTPATRVLVLGMPAILQGSSGLCLSPEQIPQGPPLVGATQPRVMGL